MKSAETFPHVPIPLRKLLPIKANASLLALSLLWSGIVQSHAIDLVSLGSAWRYEQSGTNLGTAWRAVAYNDSAWPQGPGLLGLETTLPYPYPEPIRTALTVGINKITYYFRTHFDFPANTVGIALVASNYVDDGAVFYLNGTEVGRIRMPVGVVHNQTLATNASPEGAVVVLTFASETLVQGDNVLAVEVHQASTTSSDIVFGMSLSAILPPAGILAEGFEDIFPGAWTLGGTGFQWDDVDAEFGGEGVHAGGWKGYCAGTRYGTGSREANPEYVNGMASSMSHGLPLVGFSAAYLSFWYKIPSIAPTFDQCAVLMNGTPIWRRQPAATGWSHALLDLSAYVGGTPTLTFQFLSDGANVAEGWYLDDILVTAFVAPPNDNFVNATVLEGPSGTIYGNNVNASKEIGAGETNSITGNPGGKSVWYRWTARTSGTVTFTTAGSQSAGGGMMDTLLAAYTGSTVGSLTLLKEDDDVVRNVDVTSSITFNVVAGTEYKIAVDGYSGATGRIVLNWSYNSAFNVSAAVDSATFSRSYLVKTVPGKDYFIGKADYTLRRYDDFTAAVQTDPITVRLDYELVDATDGSNVPLTASSLSFVRSMPSFDEVLVGPREPAYRSFSETFHVQPAPGVQLDSVNRRYELVVTISHVDAPGQPALTDHTRVGASEQLMHFNGRLRFGDIETTFTSIADDPLYLDLVPGLYVNLQLAVDGNSGVITGKPAYTYGRAWPLPPQVLDVRLRGDGDAEVTAVSGGSVDVTTPTPDTDEVVHVRFTRNGLVLTPSGAFATSLQVTLPTGLGYRTDTSSRILDSSYILPGVQLNQMLVPANDPVLNPVPGWWICEETKPLWIETSHVRWEVRAGNFLFSPTGAIKYVRTNELWALKHPLAPLEDSMMVKPSNDQYFRAPNLGPADLHVRVDDRGNALMSLSVLLNANRFLAHFPYNAEIHWTGGGQMDIVDDQVQPATSWLTVSATTNSYATNCLENTCPPVGANNGQPLALNPTGSQLSFTADGGLAGAGTLATASELHWGWIETAKKFAQRTEAFSEARFHMPGVFLRGDQTALAETKRPAALLLSGVSSNDLAQFERPGTDAYQNGFADYAGLNFRVNVDGAKRAESVLGGTATDPYDLTGRSKYYVRPGGVSGIHEAVPRSFPLNLTIWDYHINFDNYGLPYLDSKVHEGSRTQGTIDIPYPSDFNQAFEELTFTCLGALKDAKVPGSSGKKRLSYWLGDFTPLAISFETPTECIPRPGFLVLGVSASAAHISEPLYGKLGFKPNGHLITAADPSPSGLNSRLTGPNAFKLKGPAGESYLFHSVSDIYYNNYADYVGSSGDGFVNVAGTLDVPFFEDVKVHLQTSANTISPSAPVYLMGGWPKADSGKSSKGWQITGEDYFTKTTLDDRNRGFPTDVGADLARYRNNRADDQYHPRAQQRWLGVVDFDYPLNWSSSTRSFRSTAPVTDPLVVLTATHEVKYLSARHAELVFGAQYSGIPQVNLANLAFNAVSDTTGVAAAIDGTIGAGRAKIEKGLDELNQMLNARLDEFFKPIFDKLADPLIPNVVSRLRTSADNPLEFSGNWAATKADTILQEYLDGGGTEPDHLLGQLKGLASGVGEAARLVQQVDGYLRDASNAIAQVESLLGKNSSGQRMVASTLIKKLVGELAADYLGSFGDEKLNAALKKAEPTLDEITATLAELRRSIGQMQTRLTGIGEFKKQLETFIAGKNTELTDVVQAVRRDMTNYLGKISRKVSVGASPFTEHTDAEVAKALRQALEDRFFASTVASGLQRIFKERLYDVDATIREAIDSAFQQVNTIIRDIISQTLAEVDKSINGLLGDLNSVLGAGHVNGYAHIDGETLKLLRLDARLQLKVPDAMELNGFLQIRELDSDGAGSCGPAGGKANEVTLGALNAPLDWISSGLRADIGGKFSFQAAPFKLLGMGGLFQTTAGSINFETVEISEIGATMAFGQYENYLGAKARVRLNKYEFAGGAFFGRTCSCAPLKLVDPEVLTVLPDACAPATPITGVDAYAEGWFPINEAVGIPSSCLFNVRAGLGGGVFYFVVGSVPTYGAKLLLGLDGEVLCIVSAHGEVRMIGSKSGSDLILRGTGTMRGKIGVDPISKEFSKSVGLTYKNGDWDVDL